MKLFKNLAASIMCLLLAVVVFAGCSSQFSQAKFNFPKDEEFTQLEEDEEILNAIELLCKQASTVKDENGNIIFNGNGAIETLIENAKFSLLISKIENLETNADAIISAENGIFPTANSELEDLSINFDTDGLIEEMGTILSKVNTFFEITGVIKLKDGSTQLALKLNGNITVPIEAEEPDENGNPVYNNFTIQTGAKIYYKDSFLYVDAAASNNTDSARSIVKLPVNLIFSDGNEDADPSSTSEIYNIANNAITTLNKKLVEWSDKLNDASAHAELLETARKVKIYKCVKKSKTYFKLVLSEDASMELLSTSVPSNIYLTFNKDKLVKVCVQTTLLGVFNIEIVLENYNSLIKYPSFKTYKELSNSGEALSELEGFLRIFNPLEDFFKNSTD